MPSRQSSRVVPPEVIKWAEDSDQGGLNGWTCEKCRRTTYVIHVDPGVTPFMLACRACGAEPNTPESDCDGMGQSLMYPKSPAPIHVLRDVKWEWYRPEDDELQALERGMWEHVERGGVALRPITDAGRRKLNGLGCKPQPDEDRTYG